MKVLLTADLHSNRRWFRWLENEAGNYDLIAIAGDLLDAFSAIPMTEQTEHRVGFLKRLAEERRLQSAQATMTQFVFPNRGCQRESRSACAARSTKIDHRR